MPATMSRCSNGFSGCATRKAGAEKGVELGRTETDLESRAHQASQSRFSSASHARRMASAVPQRGERVHAPTPCLARKAQRGCEGRSIRRVSCFSVFPLPAPGEKSGQGYSPYVRVSGLVSCLNGPALEAGFISRRFWLDAAWTRGIAAAFQLRWRHAIISRSKKLRRANVPWRLAIHLCTLRKKLATLAVREFKKKQKKLLVVHFILFYTDSQYVRHKTRVRSQPLSRAAESCCCTI